MEHIEPVLFALLKLFVICFLISFWIWTIIGIFKRRDLNLLQKILWLLIVLFLNLLGAILYLILSRPKNR